MARNASLTPSYTCHGFAHTFLHLSWRQLNLPTPIMASAKRPYCLFPKRWPCNTKTHLPCLYLFHIFGIRAFAPSEVQLLGALGPREILAVQAPALAPTATPMVPLHAWCSLSRAGLHTHVAQGLPHLMVQPLHALKIAHPRTLY